VLLAALLSCHLLLVVLLLLLVGMRASNVS
jgi:hypothetical protein